MNKTLPVCVELTRSLGYWISTQVTRLSIIERLLGLKARKVYPAGEIMDRRMEGVVFEVRLGG